LSPFWGLCHGMSCKERNRSGDQPDSHVFQRASTLSEYGHPVYPIFQVTTSRVICLRS
jgi:hypothetical protein